MTIKIIVGVGGGGGVGDEGREMPKIIILTCTTFQRGSKKYSKSYTKINLKL
jgi:hypothetical protein